MLGTALAARILVREWSRGGLGDEGNRGNSANIVTANVVFATHVKAAEGRNFLAGIAGGVRGAEVQPEHIAMLVNGVEILHVHDIGDGFDVAAEPREAHGIVKALATRCVDWAVCRVVAD